MDQGTSLVWVFAKGQTGAAFQQLAAALNGTLAVHVRAVQRKHSLRAQQLAFSRDGVPHAPRPHSSRPPLPA